MSTFRHYPNVTLASLDGDLSVVVYLPIGVQDDGHPPRRGDRDPYYYSSRFDHGSMIGSITRRRRRRPNANEAASRNAINDHTDDDDEYNTHVLFGTDLWRMPHNTHWPESGVGLASEFGVGDDGALCDFRCGWPEAIAVSNGLLGYQEADNGDSFLKIGVGELVKGTCPACDSTDDYRFNSPYLFAKEPLWTMTRGSADPNAPVVLEHEATLRNYGYKLKKVISLVDNVLSVTSTLKNLGDAPFSTVWYSHNLFTCDTVTVGPGYSIDLGIKGETNHPVYEEPTTWSWSKPLINFGKLRSFPNSVHLALNKVPTPGERIKAEFADDHSTTGGFTLAACETLVESRVESPALSRDNPNGPMTMYAYNLYIERGTLSPEPQYLINNLQPDSSISWTQVMVIHDDGFTTDKGASLAGQTPVDPVLPWWNLRGMVDGTTLVSIAPGDASFLSSHGTLTVFLGVGILLLTVLQSTTLRYRRRRNYNAIA